MADLESESNVEKPEEEGVESNEVSDVVEQEREDEESKIKESNEITIPLTQDEGGQVTVNEAQDEVPEDRNESIPETEAPENENEDHIEATEPADTERPLTDEMNIEPSSTIESAKPGDVFNNESPPIPQPLTLSWSFGYNSTLPVYNTSYSDKKMLFYVCNQSGILYDCNEHKQHLLLGHGNPITCIAVSSDKRWLVSADIGYSPLMIVWDSYTAIAVRTYFDNLGQGTISVAVSYDSKYIATVGITMPQTLSIWDWTDERDTPVHTTSIPPEYGLQTYMVFNQGDSSLLVSNSEESVVFYKWDQNSIDLHCTTLTEKDFNKSPGYLSQTVFIPDTSDYAVTATSVGYGIVWETAGIHLEKADSLKAHHKSPVKLMVLHSSAISTITTHQQYIITGDVDGQVKFFDVDLTLINWYDKLKCGPIVSISFAFDTNLPKLTESSTKVSKYPDQSTLEARSFIIPNFVVSSATSNVSHITANGTIQDVIIHDSESGVPCITTHPNDSRIAITSYNGTVKLWDYNQKMVIATRSFSGKASLTAIQFDTKGDFIGVGFSNGDVLILCSITLEDKSIIFNYSQTAISHIAFSFSGGPVLYMATAGNDLTTSVYELPVSNGKDTHQSWRFLARHKAHYKKIQSLIFGAFPDSGLPRLLSLSEDRHIVEYDLANSLVDDLKLSTVSRIEQAAVPTAIAWYPPLIKESFLITANDEFKLKLFNSSTKMCRYTLLGPTFGTPIKKMCILPLNTAADSDSDCTVTPDSRRYLACITKDKVGLLILPHSGNPHNTMCFTAHSQNVSDLAVSHDGCYVFTAGDQDCTVNMWTVNTDALEVSAALGGPELEPFYSLIEGGRDGPFFAELEEFFYYAQIRSQGSNTMDGRKVSLGIPLNQIPFVMRAIGFYPSEQEIDNMMNEVRFSRYAESGEYVSTIDLEDFIKLYINHRPVHGLSTGLFANAFKTLGEIDFESKQWKIDRAYLLETLQERGEHLTETELIEHLMTLLGYSSNPEGDGLYIASPDNVLFNEIPEVVSAQEFVESIAGLSSTS